MNPTNDSPERELAERDSPEKKNSLTNDIVLTRVSKDVKSVITRGIYTQTFFQRIYRKKLRKDCEKKNREKDADSGLNDAHCALCICLLLLNVSAAFE